MGINLFFCIETRSMVTTEATIEIPVMIIQLPSRYVITISQLSRLSSYFSRKTGMDEITEEITGDITDFEKRLLLEQDVINIRGKVIPRNSFISLVLK